MRLSLLACPYIVDLRKRVLGYAYIVPSCFDLSGWLISCDNFWGIADLTACIGADMLW